MRQKSFLNTLWLEVSTANKNSQAPVILMQEDDDTTGNIWNCLKIYNQMIFLRYFQYLLKKLWLAFIIISKTEDKKNLSPFR